MRNQDDSREAGPGAQARGLIRQPVPLAFAALGGVELVRLLLGQSPLDLLGFGVAVLAGGVSLREAHRAASVEGGRRSEAESFARILRGLSRSVSPDAIVDAIVEELGAGAGADHVAVVRRRPETRSLEAVLSPTRPGSAQARTTLSIRELEDPAVERAMVDVAITASRGRRMTAIPIQPDPAGDPHLDRLGLDARARTVFPAGEPSISLRPASAGAVAGSGAPMRDRLEPAATSYATGDAVPRSRRDHAAPARIGAEQRIADRIADRLRETYGLRNTLAAPLRVNGRVEGAIVLSRRANASWADGANRLLEAAAVEASAALARVYSLREAEVRATTDALTGLPNRRYFDEYVGVLARRRRAEDRVGVLMVDIDHFKNLNDTFGHAVGDHVLREVAQAIGRAVREGDVPSRYGGEEFAVLLRNPTVDVAMEVGERVRRAVASLDLRRLGVPGVSVSVGVAVADQPDVPLEDVIDEADQALYRAKRSGRDRVVAS